MAVRDKEWLTLEACREFQRGTCSRTEQECKYAHPSNSVVVENGRVIACYDSMKGQCTRENCRYLHPPPHLKTQLEIKGQNNIAARRMLQNQLQSQILAQQASPLPIQPTLLPTVPTTLPTGAPTVPHSTLSQHMYPGSYLSQAVQTALPTVATSPAVSGSANSTAHPGFSEIPLQTSIIPGTAGGPSLQFVPLKTTKNDRLEMWNYFKDDSSRWQSSPEYSNYLQNHPTLSTCIPRPPKVQASMVAQPQLAPPTMFPPNFLYNPMTPMTVMTQPQFLPAPLPMMPTPAIPFMTQHFLQNQNTSETLPVCRDFKSGNCKRPNCKYAHVVEDKVEIVEGKVTLCRDAAKGKCMRTNCKYYHVPVTATNGILPATASANATAASATF